MKELSGYSLGYGLMTVGGTVNDLGEGPTMMKRVFNSRPINPGTISKIKQNVASHGLLSHFPANAISIGVKKEYIQGGLETAKMDEPINKHVVWSNAAKEQEATMTLLNGNHRATFIEQKFAQEFFNYHKARTLARDASLTPREKAETLEQVEVIGNFLRNNACWLAQFFDMGEASSQLVYAYANEMSRSDAIEASPQRKLLLHEITSNIILPAKEDTDTDKVHSLVRLLKADMSSKERKKLISSCVAQWMEIRGGSGARPAWAVTYGRLFEFLADLYRIEEFEVSKNLTISSLYANWNPFLTGVGTEYRL